MSTNGKPETIEIPTWCVDGEIRKNRFCLPADHPEAPYHYVQREYGVDPEDYGITKPVPNYPDEGCIGYDDPANDSNRRM